MSYDYPEGYVPPPPERGLRAWLETKYYNLVIWCALDAPFKVLNEWGARRLMIPEKI